MAENMKEGHRIRNLHQDTCLFAGRKPQDDVAAYHWRTLMVARAEQKKAGKEVKGPNPLRLFKECTARMVSVSTLKEGEELAGEPKLRPVSLQPPVEKEDLVHLFNLFPGKDDVPGVVWPSMLPSSTQLQAPTRGLEFFAPSPMAYYDLPAIFLKADVGSFVQMQPAPFPLRSIYVPLYGKVVWILFPPCTKDVAFALLDRALTGEVDHPDGLIGEFLSVDEIREDIIPRIAITDAADGKCLYVPPRWRYVAWAIGDGYLEFKITGLREGVWEGVALFGVRAAMLGPSEREDARELAMHVP